MEEQFSRTELLIGKDGVEKLKKSEVAIFGLGGVGSYVVEALARSGVSTIIVMNISDKLLDECKKYYINVVCAGHMSSDSLGINLLFKAIKEKTKENFEIIPASGYIFVER